MTAQTTTKQADSPTAPEVVVAEIETSQASDAAKTEEHAISSDSKNAETAQDTTDQADSPTASNVVVTEIDETSKSSDTAETLNQDEASSSVSKEGNSVAQETKSDVSNDTTKVSKPKFLSQLKATQPTFKDPPPIVLPQKKKNLQHRQSQSSSLSSSPERLRPTQAEGGF